MNWIIALGSNNKHVHFARAYALNQYIRQHGDEINTIICSGGIVWNYTTSEASRMQKYIKKTLQHLPHIHTKLEEDSRNTEENLINSFPLIPANTHSIILFSSQWHLKRIRSLVENLIQPTQSIEYVGMETYFNDERFDTHPQWIQLQRKYQTQEMIARIPGAKTAFKIIKRK